MDGFGHIYTVKYVAVCKFQWKLTAIYPLK